MAYEKAAEILVRSEEEIDRPELLSLVQIHHAQVDFHLTKICWFLCTF